jgi:hypothetical protein
MMSGVQLSAPDNAIALDLNHHFTGRTRKMRFASIGTALAAFLMAIGAFLGIPAANAAEPSTAVACDTIGQAPNTVKRFTLFDGAGPSGACIEFYGFGNCTGHYQDNEGLYQLPSFGWDNKTSAVDTHNNCDVRFYDGAHCPSQGVQTGWINYSENLGAWSNRASCVLVS